VRGLGTVWLCCSRPARSGSYSSAIGCVLQADLRGHEPHRCLGFPSSFRPALLWSTAPEALGFPSVLGHYPTGRGCSPSEWLAVGYALKLTSFRLRSLEFLMSQFSQHVSNSVVYELFDDPQAHIACAPLSDHTSWGSFTMGVLEAIHGVAHARVPAEASKCISPPARTAPHPLPRPPAPASRPRCVWEGRRPDPSRPGWPP
jgi:hypothetical protein